LVHTFFEDKLKILVAQTIEVHSTNYPKLSKLNNQFFLWTNPLIFIHSWIFHTNTTEIFLKDINLDDVGEAMTPTRWHSQQSGFKYAHLWLLIFWYNADSSERYCSTFQRLPSLAEGVQHSAALWLPFRWGKLNIRCGIEHRYNLGRWSFPLAWCLRQADCSFCLQGW